MTFSKLISGTVPYAAGQRSKRTRTVDGMIMHHGATTSQASIEAAFADPGREITANYLIGNDGRIWGVVPEEYRAWTSASPEWDGRSITFECVNESGGPAWSISKAAQEAIAQLLADVATRYGFTPKRGRTGNVFGHRELWEYFEASYPTACPGAMPVDSITKRARALLASGSTTNNQEIIMKAYTPKDTNSKNRPQVIPANGQYVNAVISDVKANGSRDVSIATKKPVIAAASLYLKGKPGQTAELAFTVATVKNGKLVSEKRVLTVDTPPIPAGDTLVKALITYPVPLKADERLRVQVRVDGKEPLTVTRIGWSVK